MRLKYSRILKLVGLVLFIVFVLPLFFDSKPKLRSSDIDIERQIDLAFENQEKHVADIKKEKANDGDINHNVSFFIFLRVLLIRSNFN
jgi:hypothetical protein